MDRRKILEKLRAVQITLSTTKQDIFDTKGVAIPAGKMRFVVALVLIGDGDTSTTVDVQKKEKDGSYKDIFKGVPVGPAQIVMLPGPDWRYDAENPFMSLEYGTDLAAVASAGAPELTVIYWDD